MATTTLPRRKKLSGRWIAVGIVLIVVAIARRALHQRQRPARVRVQGNRPSRSPGGTSRRRVAGSGRVAAEQIPQSPLPDGRRRSPRYSSRKGTRCRPDRRWPGWTTVPLQLPGCRAPAARLESAARRESWRRPSKATPRPEDLAAGAGAAGVGAGELRQGQPTAPSAADQGVGPGGGPQRPGGPPCGRRVGRHVRIRSWRRPRPHCRRPKPTCSQAQAKLRSGLPSNPDIARRPEALVAGTSATTELPAGQGELRIRSPRPPAPTPSPESRRPRRSWRRPGRASPS